MSKQKLVPNLRFSEFSDEWTSSKLKEICIVQDGTHSTPNYTDSGIPFFSVDTIINNVPPKYISEKDHKKLIKRCEPKKGDILLSRITGGILGFPKLVDWDYEFSIYVSLALLSSITINSNYLNYYIQSPVYRADFLSKSLLIASPPKINLSDLEITLIKYPSAIEQEKISNFISLVDKKIGLLEQKYQHYQEFKKYLMQQIFAQKLRFANFTDEWKSMKLKDIGIINTGNTPSTTIKEYYSPEKYLWVTPSDISSKYIADTNKKLSEEGSKKGRFVKRNSVLVTCIASIGKNCIIKEDGYFNQQINSITPQEGYNTDFIYYLICYNSERMKNYAGITATPILNKKSFENMTFEFPEFEEQEKIASLLSNIDKKIEIIQTQLSEMNQFKKGLLQQMLI